MEFKTITSVKNYVRHLFVPPCILFVFPSIKNYATLFAD